MKDMLYIPWQCYNDIMMSMMASQITSHTIVYSTVYSGAYEKNIKVPRHWREGNSPMTVNSPHKGPVTRKMFPFDDVIMKILRQLRMMSSFLVLNVPLKTHWGWFSIKIPSYQYRKSHCGDKAILWLSYLHNEISYTGKMTFLYWIRALCSHLWRFYISQMVHPGVK